MGAATRWRPTPTSGPRLPRPWCRPAAACWRWGSRPNRWMPFIRVISRRLAMQQPGVKRVSRPHVERSAPQPPPVERAREGSPWVGLGAVITKEMADHLTSARMRILEILIVLTAAGTVYAALSSIRTNISQDPFLYLGLFT